MRRTLIRAFDSYTSTDGGDTWTAPTAGNAAAASGLLRHRAGRRRAAVQNGSTTTYATDVKDVVGSTTRNPAWELDGYSNYINGSFTANAALGSDELSQLGKRRLSTVTRRGPATTARPSSSGLPTRAGR